MNFIENEPKVFKTTAKIIIGDKGYGFLGDKYPMQVLLARLGKIALEKGKK